MQQYKIDWSKARKDFVVGNMPVREIAEKYGVSTTSVQKRSMRESWMRDRETYHAKQVNEKADLMIAQVRARGGDIQYIAEGMDEELKRCIKLLGEDGVSAQTRYNLIQCVKFAWQVMKDVRGILTRVDLEKLDIARQELQMKREEHKKIMNQDLVKQEPIRVIIGGKRDEDEKDEDMAL